MSNDNVKPAFFALITILTTKRVSRQDSGCPTCYSQPFRQQLRTATRHFEQATVTSAINTVPRSEKSGCNTESMLVTEMFKTPAPYFSISCQYTSKGTTLSFYAFTCCKDAGKAGESPCMWSSDPLPQRCSVRRAPALWE